MKLREYPYAGPPVRAVVCMGVFDGVHIGHQAVIGRCVEAAREAGVASAAITFDRDPERVLIPETPIPQVCTLSQKERLIERLGAGYLLVLPFDNAMAALSAADFLGRHLLAAFAPVAVVVGENFRFGAGGSGDVELLRKYGSEHGFEVDALPLVSAAGNPVSSTRIRTLLERGEVAEATKLLGRPFAVEGVVIRGAGRGSRLGFHTANVEVPAELAIPACGVYAGAVTIADRLRPAAINVGTRPTFESGDTVWVEVHVIELEADLYGTHMEVAFLQRLRDELRFDSPAELRERAARDIAEAKEIFARLLPTRTALW